jgi:hypothetical protein
MLLSVTPRTINIWEKKGLPVAFYIGNFPRYNYDDVIFWFNNHKVKNVKGGDKNL